MSIPKNMNNEHILNAIQGIDQNGIPKDAEPTFYDLIVESINLKLKVDRTWLKVKLWFLPSTKKPSPNN